MSAPRVVLDTNVVVSALLFRTGALAWLRHASQAEAIRPLASRFSVGELIRVLAYPKFRLSDAVRDDLLADYLPWCETVTLTAALGVPDCRDEFDRPFLELAITGRADALLTGDRDLLALAGRFAVAIVTPAEFWDGFGVA